MMRILAVGVAVVAMAGCGADRTTPPTTAAPATTTTLVGRACADFGTLLTDQVKGLLTDAELRDRIKTIYAESDGGPQPIRQAAQELLAADTGGNVASIQIAEDTMSKACLADYSAHGG